MLTLTELANIYQSDKGTKKPATGHHGPRLNFTKIYEQFLDPLRDIPVDFLEIGIGSGPSLKMWYDFFHNGKISAIDIVDCSRFDNDRIKTFIADQTKREQLRVVVERTPEFDIIIDDGGHMMGQQQISFGFLFKHVKSGGMYFIEDLHTSYWPHNGFKDLYGQKLDINHGRTNTTIRMIENFIETGKIESEFMTEKEMQYLNDNIADCKIFDLPETMYGPNKLALFLKK